MKILLITDAWEPQTNGVVTTLKNLCRELESDDHQVTVIHPGQFWGFPMPGYQEIKLAFPSKRKVKNILTKDWDAIHIATPEGSVGGAFIKGCRKLNLNFTASLHTKIPEFVNSRLPFISIDRGWQMMKKRFADAKNILVPTGSMAAELFDRGFEQNISVWTRGVDRTIFFPDEKITREKILLCVSRVSPEKNLEDFFNLPMPGMKKIMVGDGPYLNTYKEKYPNVEFVGKKTGKELADYYRRASVFVFPSCTDTFGVVMIEAMSCGVPVAAYPVTGPIDVVQEGITGYTDVDLHKAVEKCFALGRIGVSQGSLKWRWEECKRHFLSTLVTP